MSNEHILYMNHNGRSKNHSPSTVIFFKMPNKFRCFGFRKKIKIASTEFCVLANSWLYTGELAIYGGVKWYSTECRSKNHSPSTVIFFKMPNEVRCFGFRRSRLLQLCSVYREDYGTIYSILLREVLRTLHSTESLHACIFTQRKDYMKVSDQRHTKPRTISNLEICFDNTLSP
jgi:hypothetical protein